MKKLLVALVASLCLFSGAAYAETSIGVVNVTKILQDSKAAKSATAQLQAKQKAFQNDLDAKEKALHAESQALEKQKNSADKAAFEKKVKEFREKAANEQRDIQKKTVSINKAQSAATEEVLKNTYEIVKQISSEKKFNLVIPSTQVLYVDTSLDITDEVLKRLDAKLPTVAVKF